MKTKSLVKIEAPELNALEASKAEMIRSTFEPMANMLSEFEEAYNVIISESESGITKETTQKAKRLRLDIGKIRISTEKVRKEQKEQYLRAGKAIDGVANILKWAVADKETKLEEIENHFEILEKKRIEALQKEREALICEYVNDAHLLSLGAMADDVFNAYFAAKKKEFEDLKEAERQAELKRIEEEKKEAAERERIRVENERLKKEAEEREKQLQAERKAAEEAAKKEREEAAKKLAEEKAKAEKAQAELKAKQEAERKAAEEAEAALQAELSKGDKEKVNDLIADLRAIKAKYIFKSKKEKKMYEDVQTLIDKIIAHIQK